MSSTTAHQVKCKPCDGNGFTVGRQLDVDHFEADVPCKACGGAGEVDCVPGRCDDCADARGWKVGPATDDSIRPCGHDVDQPSCECHDSPECHECWFEGEAEYWRGYFGRNPKAFAPVDEFNPEYRQDLIDAGRGHLVRR